MVTATIGKYYSPYQIGNIEIHKCIYIDDNFYYFTDKIKYPKTVEFTWHERDLSNMSMQESSNFWIMSKNEYSDEAKRLANENSFEKLFDNYVKLSNKMEAEPSDKTYIEKLNYEAAMSILIDN